MSVQYIMWPSSLKRAGHTVVRVSPADALFHALKEIPIHEFYEMHMGRRAQLPCKLDPSSPFWDGKPREWCPVHQGSYGRPFQLKAFEASGVRRCDQSDERIDFVLASDIPLLILVPDGKASSPNEYCDIGIWIGLPPSVNSFGDTKFFPGIHVHARRTMAGEKVIDKNFPAVRIQDKTGRFPRISPEGVLITSPAALELLYVKELTCPVAISDLRPMPRSLVKITENVRCEHCHATHADVGDVFGEIPHKKHLCGQCGRDIHCPESGIGNPLAVFIQDRVLREPVAEPHLREVHIDTAEMKVMIWPSTPAVFWSRKTAEVWGIHVHAFDERGQRVVDDTFRRVFLDGQELDRKVLFQDMLVASEWLTEDYDDAVDAEELEDD